MIQRLNGLGDEGIDLAHIARVAPLARKARAIAVPMPAPMMRTICPVKSAILAPLDGVAAGSS